MAEVLLDNIYKDFGEVVAVDGISLNILDQEFLTLVGPSGCGKSTTLRLIAGLEQLTKGQIFLGRDPVGHLPPDKRDIAMVFQSYALYPHMDVRQNIGFALKMMKTDKDETNQRVERTAEMLGIGHLLDRKPRELSGGQRQRVALGRALVRNSGAYLLDEPLSNLDAKLRIQMRAEIKKLHADLQRTFIYVTHDQSEAMTMSDRIVVMNEGEIQQCASPLEIYDTPTNLFVAQFMGSPPMNVLDGEVQQVEGTYYFQSEGIRQPLPPHLSWGVEKAGSRETSLGIRPEDAFLATEPDTDDTWHQVSVFVEETMGSENLVTLDMHESQFKVRTGAEFRTRPGQNLYMRFNSEKLHLFDRHNGQALREEAVAAAADG